jgi:hypothetical protein
MGLHLVCRPTLMVGPGMDIIMDVKVTRSGDDMREGSSQVIRSIYPM